MNLALGLDEPESLLRQRAAEAAGLPVSAIEGLRVARRSLDARRRGSLRTLRYIVHVDCVASAAASGIAYDKAVKAGRVRMLPPEESLAAKHPHPSVADARTVVVGAGPAGLFAALPLALAGVSVDLVERGPRLEDRGRMIAAFYRRREVDPERNLLFGEGGAGTYSDGKLYTRVSHPLEGAILKVLIDCGAPEAIAWDARAHIGTDRLHRILPKLRARLESLGVRFHWDTRLEGIDFGSESGTRDTTQRRVLSARTTLGRIECDAVFLAVGHSARDTLRRLADEGVAVEAKPFQMGLRIEHPQAMIDRERHGEGPEAKRLGPAYYGLVSPARDGRPAAHTFCMCPGGQTVAAVSEPGLLCTNGMSNSRHSSPYANSGIVVTVGPAEFGAGAFAGVDMQRRLERRFFDAGGGDYSLPAQRVPDFLAGRETQGELATSYKLGVRAARIDALLDASMRDGLRHALASFDRQIRGYAGHAAILVGIESRSSGPVRLPRDPDNRMAIGNDGLYPIGEGAGYAGGIMSAAIDGARSALVFIERGTQMGRTNGLRGPGTRPGAARRVERGDAAPHRLTSPLGAGARVLP